MITATWHTNARSHRHAPGLLARVQETIALWRERARDRAELSQLTERDLRDARISHAAFRNELAKPFWRG
jgi:uncharacterized protein YjiS (DUF1127 family)